MVKDNNGGVGGANTIGSLWPIRQGGGLLYQFVHWVSYLHKNVFLFNRQFRPRSVSSGMFVEGVGGRWQHAGTVWRLHLTPAHHFCVEFNIDVRLLY